jgi:hypothetical protein
LTIILKKDKKGLTFEITKYIFAPHLKENALELKIKSLGGVGEWLNPPVC